MTVSQDTFRAALLNPTHPAPAGLSDGTTRPPGARFDVYRNNVAVSLTEALHSGFSVIAKLLGKENMDGLAGLYLRAHPPSSPLMMHYGAEFPDFLADLPQLAHLGYLPDVARLELALRRSYHAADAQPIDPSQLGRLDPADLMQAKVTFAPSVQLVRSQWPLFDIWRFNTQDNAPKPAHVAQDVLICRARFDPLPHPLCAGGAAWIAGLQDGLGIGAALDAAQSQAADFDMTTTLATLLTGNALISLTTKA